VPSPREKSLLALQSPGERKDCPASNAFSVRDTWLDETTSGEADPASAGTSRDNENRTVSRLPSIRWRQDASSSSNDRVLRVKRGRYVALEPFTRFEEETLAAIRSGYCPPVSINRRWPDTRHAYIFSPCRVDAEDNVAASSGGRSEREDAGREPAKSEIKERAEKGREREREREREGRWLHLGVVFTTSFPR